MSAVFISFWYGQLSKLFTYVCESIQSNRDNILGRTSINEEEEERPASSQLEARHLSRAETARDQLVRMHHKVVGSFRSEADVRSLYYRR